MTLAPKKLLIYISNYNCRNCYFGRKYDYNAWTVCRRNFWSSAYKINLPQSTTGIGGKRAKNDVG